MCLAIPMQVVKFTGKNTATVELHRHQTEVNVSLVDGLHKGDYVVVHAGFAIERLNVQEAEKQPAFLAELAAWDN